MKTIMFLTLIFLTMQAATVQQLFSVQTIKVKQLQEAKSIQSYGFVRVDDARVYDVAPRFSGYVETLYADSLYKRVSKGEALVKVYSPEVLKAKDEYANSVRYSKNRTMIESSKTKLQLLDIPETEIGTKVKGRNFTTITSPVNGYIFKKNINNNAAFQAKQKLFEIVNLDKVWVEVRIHQDQVALLQNVYKYSLQSETSPIRYEVQNAMLYPKLDEKDESFTLRLEIENSQKELMPGMYMKVKMLQKQKSYLTLPVTAVIRKNGTYYAFVVGEYEGEYEPLEIEVELLDPNTYIIKSGLVAGDEVVNNALFMMDSDAQVNGLY